MKKVYSHHSSLTPYYYYRVSKYIPYLDSIINSLEVRFSEYNEIAFKLGVFITSEMVQIDKKSFKLILEEVQYHFQIDNPNTKLENINISN